MKWFFFLLCCLLLIPPLAFAETNIFDSQSFQQQFPNYYNYAAGLFGFDSNANYPNIKVHVEKGYEYEQQWINEKFAEINKTAPRFLELVNKAGVEIYVGVNENGNHISVSQTGPHKMWLHNVDRDIRGGFITILVHELGHVIDKNNDGKISGRAYLWSAVVSDAGGNPRNYFNGLLTNYAKYPESCNSSIDPGSIETQLGEDYAEVFAYYLNPTQVETTGCGINIQTLPYANGKHSNQKALAEYVLFGKPLSFKIL